MIRTTRRSAVVIACAVAGTLSMALAGSGLPGPAATVGSTSPTVDSEPSVIADTVEIVPAAGTRLDVGGVGLRGVVTVTGHDTGLAAVERLAVDDYLLGIAEVPFSWEAEALAAQAVAARTYLARTLADGRTADGRRYGYDICATTACQVYAGVDLVEGPEGDRWSDAVRRTSGQILLDERGLPARAFYSSTSGGRTRSVEDIFTGAEPVPYLTAVDSPGEDSPFVEWAFVVTGWEMERLALEAGLIEGELIDVSTTVTEDGEGPWTVTFEGTERSSVVPTWELRTSLNRAAQATMPERLPVERPDVDRRYPQTILSPSFVISSTDVVLPAVLGPSPTVRLYRIEGTGWGHLVGMSQYGAQAMGGRGANYPDILAHFYGGLRPADASDRLPEELTVAIAEEVPDLLVAPDGPVEVSVDGTTIATDALGGWRMEASGERIRVWPPVGLGIPPEIESVVVTGRVVMVDLNAAGRLFVGARIGREWTTLRTWDLVEAGRVVSIASGEVDRVTVMVRSGDGFDRRTVSVTIQECLPGAPCFPR